MFTNVLSTIKKKEHRNEICSLYLLKEWREKFCKVPVLHFVSTVSFSDFFFFLVCQGCVCSTAAF